MRRRHEDHFGGRIEFHDPLQHFHPAKMRHHQIGQHDLGVLVVHQIQALFGIGSRQDLETGLRQRGRQQLPELFSLSSMISRESAGWVFDDMAVLV